MPRKRFLAVWFTTCPQIWKRPLASDPQVLTAWEVLHRSHEMSGYVGSNQLKAETRSSRIE
jgi:hypothetical protein